MVASFGRSLPDLGTISYSVGNAADDTFVFPAATTVHVQVEPVYTKDGRAVKYRRYTFTCRCVVTAEDFGAAVTDTLDNEVGGTLQIYDLRRILSTPGGTFTFLGHGLGTFTVGPTNDLEFGPKPDLSTYAFLGASNAVELTWRVTVAVADCKQLSSNNVPNVRFTELSYSVSFSIDDKGMTTRTIDGYFESPVFKKPGDPLSIDKTADLFIENVTPPLAEGFKRHQSRRLSEDRRGVEYKIVDTEIPSDFPYFKNLVDMQGTYTVSSEGLFARSQSMPWIIRMQGRFTTRPGVPRSTAWSAFAAMVRSRLKISTSPPGKAVENNTTKFVYVADFRIEEELFTRTHSFGITWKILCPFEKVIGRCGIWQPLDEKETWTTWAASLKDVLGPTGSAKLRFDTNEDRIVVLCEPQAAYQSPDKKPEPYRKGGSIPKDEPKKPPKEYSYDTYYLGAKIYKHPNTSTHRMLGNGGNDSQTHASLSGKQLSTGDSSPSRRSLLIQERGVSNVVLALYGYATRIGYSVLAPKLLSVAGTTPTIVSQHIDCSATPVGHTPEGIPLFTGMWATTYELPSTGQFPYDVADLPIDSLPQLGDPP